MDSKKLALGGVVAALLAVLGWWMLRNPEAQDRPAAADPPAKVERGDRRQRKMDLRAEAPEIEPVTLVGLVRDEGTRPVAGAVVLLTSKSFEQSMGRTGERPQPVHVRSDAGGAFSIGKVPPGHYTVSASANGFLPASLRSVRVLPGQDPAPIELLLRKGGQTVTGRVEDVAGGPVEGALVSVSRRDADNLFRTSAAPAAALTDDDGAFAMTLASGAYGATVSHPDYVSASKSFDVTEAPRTIQIRLTPGAVIEGVVKVRGTEETVADAIVVAERPSSARVGSFSTRGLGEHRVVSGANGRFRLSGLPSGILQLNAVASAQASVEVTEVALGIAETVSDVVVWVEPAHAIRGFVVPRGSEGAEGIEGVWVGALSLNPAGLYVARTPSEADGFFEIPGVQPGNYMVAALGEDHLPNLTGTSATVEDEDVEGVLVEMTGGATIRGRIEPPGPARVSLRMRSEGMGFSGVLSNIGNAFVQTRTDDDGRFELRPVSPGELEVVAQADDGSHGVLTVDVSEEGAEGVVIEVEPRVSLEGTVVGPSGDPVDDAKVSAVRIDGEPEPPSISFSANDNPLLGGGAPTREDGSFVVRGLEPGEYEVSVSAGRGPSLKFADGTEGPMRLTVPEGGLSGLRLAVEARDAELTGVVIDEDGAPVADAWVVAALEGGGDAWMEDLVRARRPSRGREVEARMQDDPKSPEGASALGMFGAEPPVLTDDAGRFTITGLRAGTYRVTAESSGGGERVSEEGVTPGSDLRLEVRALAGLEGQLAQGAKAVSSYTLTLKGPTSRSKQVHNAAGEFFLNGLDPGTYTVEARADAGVASAEVEVDEGRVTEVDLVLESFGTLTGTVVSNTGEPLSGLMVMVAPAGSTPDVSAGLQMLTGGGPRTDRRGKFEVGNVPPGEGLLRVFDPDGGEGGGAATSYAVGAGESEDVGTIIAVKAGDVPVAERGTLGLRTAVRDWNQRPLDPDADPEDAEPPADPERDRLWIRAVSEEGPAEAAGLRPGDEVIAVDDQDVAGLGARTAASMLGPSHFRVGDSVALRVLRDGSESRVTLTAGERDLQALGLPQ